MINFNTILSSYDERGTLLKWLKTLDNALENGSLSTVTTTTGDDYVIFHFTFADGTSVDSPAIPLEAGPQGPQGDPGPQGEPGVDGVDGEDGDAATISVGTVTTLAPGSDATVTNSGTSSAAVFDFGIPQGATGNPGEIIEQIVPVEATTTASRAYAVGDYFVNNLGVLVKATAAIALGATIDNTNSTAVNATLADETAYSHKILTSGISYINVIIGNMGSALASDFSGLKTLMPDKTQCCGYCYQVTAGGNTVSGSFHAVKDSRVSSSLKVNIITETNTVVHLNV